MRRLLNLDKCRLAVINAKIESEAFELVDVDVEIGRNVPLWLGFIFFGQGLAFCDFSKKLR